MPDVRVNRKINTNASKEAKQFLFKKDKLSQIGSLINLLESLILAQDERWRRA